MSPTLAGVMAAVLLALAIRLWAASRRQERVRARLFAQQADPVAGRSADSPDPGAGDTASLRPGPLALWLLRAGHRDPQAPATFVVLCLVFAVLGLGATVLLRAAGLAERAGELIAGLPVIGAGLAVAFTAAPWLAGIAIAALPIQVVARQRAQRSARIDEDLPLVIELLATLVEAGLGFEAALAEVLRAQPDHRPLGEELRLFQLELSAGERRREALHRLGERVGVPAMTAFVSALVHADLTGASLAATLRPEARQARQARRERALARAEALPEKLVVPLLVGFLPSLLVWTLGPAFFQLFSMLDAAFR